MKGDVMKLFEEFKVICKKLNQAGIIPTLMGSLGLEYVSEVPQRIPIETIGTTIKILQK